MTCVHINRAASFKPPSVAHKHGMHTHVRPVQCTNSHVRHATARASKRGSCDPVELADADKASLPLPVANAAACSTKRRDMLLLAGLLSASTGVTFVSGAEAKDYKGEGWYDVPPASDPKTVVITGANSGIGFAASSALAAAGHNVYMVCRTAKKAADACAQVREANGSLKGSVTPEECELGDMDSIRAFAQRWNDSGKPLDVLSLNAGAQFVGQKEPKRTKDGFELTVGVNHLGHFLLANLLLPALERSDKRPRVVVTSSEVHDPTSPGGKIGPGASLGDLSGLQSGPRFDMVSGEPFDADKAYKDSKLCNALFAREFAKRLRTSNSAVTCNAFGPGLITRSGFFRSAPSSFIGIFDFVTNNVLGVAETVSGAGDCLAFMAVDSSLDGRTGLYYNNDTAGIPAFSPSHKFTEQLPSEEAQRDDEAKRLWDLSAKLVQLEA